MGPMSNGIMSQNLDSVIALMRSPVQFQWAIQQPRNINLSLIGYESMTNASAPKTSTSVLRIHDLVQFVIQGSARRENTHHEWFHVAAELVCGVVQRVGHALGKQPWSHLYWSQCVILSPHMQLLTKWRDGHAMQNPVLDKANTNIAQYLDARGRYRDAEMLVLPALANLEKLLGPEHLDTLRTASVLANVFEAQGHYNKAEILLVRGLAVREKLLGPYHLDTLLVVNNYCKQGQ
jgi:hypothetical protein